MSNPLIWILDDDLQQIRILGFLLEEAGYRTRSFDRAEDLLAALVEIEEASALLLDLRMPGLGGEEALAEIRSQEPGLPVLITSGQQDVDTAVQILQSGAWDYLTKPIDDDKLLLSLGRAVRQRELELQVRELKSSSLRGMDRLIGQSAAMRRIYELIRRSAESRIPVLIQGESGTGKELVAQAIHNLDQHFKGEFISLNCAAIPRELVESELFGHEKGSFTGAHQQRLGAFERANGGTLFLDEIGELSPGVQAKLLRVLQEWSVRRVGGDREIRLNLRLITATKQQLSSMVHDGKFRDDLYYRINHITMQLPPLRERRQDMGLLISHFLGKHSQSFGKDDLVSPDGELLDFCKTYTWPGNVRQLENAICRALAVSQSSSISILDFPEELQAEWKSMQESPPGLVARQQGSSPTGIERRVTPQGTGLPQRRETDWLNVFQSKGELLTLERMRELYINHALKLHNGAMQETAKSLGIGRTTLYRQLRNLEGD